jgi:hypothetical protein
VQWPFNGLRPRERPRDVEDEDTIPASPVMEPVFIDDEDGWKRWQHGLVPPAVSHGGGAGAG